MEIAKKTLSLIHLISFFLILLVVSPLLTAMIFPQVEAVAYIEQLFPFAISLGIFTIVLRKTEKRSVLSLFSIDRPFSWKRMTIVFLSLTAFFFLALLSDTDRLVPTEEAWTVIAMSAITSIVMLPMQVLAEELLFRVLPLYMITGEKKPEGWEKIVAIALSALLFLVMHLSNPEIEEAGMSILAVYFLSGAALMLFTVLEGGFESAIGFHLANNLFLAIVANYKNTVLDSTPIFTVVGTLSVWRSLVELVVSVAITLLIIRFTGTEGKRGR